MKNRVTIIAVVAAASLAFASTAWSQRAPVPVVVANAKVAPTNVTVRLPGTVIASRTARLSSAIGGLVKTVSVDFGDRVNVGDVLVVLDHERAELQLAQSRAAVQEAQAGLTEKQRLLRVGRNLARRGVLTKDQSDSRRADVLIAQAGVKKLRAAQASMQQLLDRHRIAAPFAGVVAKKLVESGEWVSPGTTIVELIADQDPLVDVSLPQKYFSQLNDQSEISVSFEAIPGKTVTGLRAAISPVSDPTMRTFKLRVSLAPESRAQVPGVAPGMSAQVTLTLRRNASSVVIPRDAIVRQADGRTTVWVASIAAGEDGFATVSRKTVRIGNSFGQNVVVLSGLDATDRVVVGGNESLRPKQKVRIAGTHD